MKEGPGWVIEAQDAKGAVIAYGKEATVEQALCLIGAAMKNEGVFIVVENEDQHILRKRHEEGLGPQVVIEGLPCHRVVTGLKP